MAHLAGKAGNVYIADELLEDCEDAWNEYVDGDVTATAATGAKVGDYCAKLAALAAVDDGDILATEVIASVDITTYSRLMYWAKCSVNINTAGDLQVGVSETASLGGSPVYSDIPILVANTWKYCSSAIVVTGLNAVISIGAKLTANDPGAFDLYLDDIRAAKVVAGIKAWALDYTYDTLDVTDFGDVGVRAFIPSTSQWSGSFEGYKDGAPLTIGSQYGIELRESATATQWWSGNAIITGVHARIDFDGVVSYVYDFQGSGAIVIASA